MEELLLHIVRPVVNNPDDVSIQVVDGEAATVLELSVNPADVERVRGREGRTLRSVRNIISAAAGKKKASVDLVTEAAATEDTEEE
jgi:predicted RNA-binding protein YlqC (UPF0109 family)